jgi:hypothetical protein
MSDTCDTCRNFLIANKNKFGIKEPVPECQCLDLCVQNVRYISNIPVSKTLPLPGADDIFQNCRGIIDIPGDIDKTFCQFRVTCAKEQLVDCNTDNPGVRIVVRGRVILKTIPQGPYDKPSFIALPVDILDIITKTFFTADSGGLITNLKEALRFIDGSCIVVQLTCSIVENPTGVFNIKIEGNVVDKLWKEDNIWVVGIRPYPLPSITVKQEFPEQNLICNNS